MNNRPEKFACPECLSMDVEELILVWKPMNGPARTDFDYEPAEAYPDKYWCNECEDHFDEPTKVILVEVGLYGKKESKQ